MGISILYRGEPASASSRFSRNYKHLLKKYLFDTSGGRDHK